MSEFGQKFDEFFRISKRGSSVQKEIKGGVITFLSMAYILIVNPSILSAGAGASYSIPQLFTATALAAGISCILMGLYSRFPVALAPGMGINAFLAYTVCLVMGFSFEWALMATFIAGVLFFLISISGWRKKMIDDIPKSMKLAIAAGIGAFIASLGLFNAGIIVHADGMPLTFGHLNDPGVLLGLFCLIVTLILWFVKKWYAVIAGMVLTWAVGLIMSTCGVISPLVEEGMYLIPQWDPSNFVSTPDFALFGAVFTNLGEFPHAAVVGFIVAIISLLVVSLFDTTGTLIGVGSGANMIDADGHLIDGDKALKADAAAGCIGAVCGTSTTTSFAESITGVNAGARTGLMPIVVGILFFVALLFSGFFGTFTSACTVGALVLVGIMMISTLKDAEWKDPINIAVIFMTVFMMIFTGSITNGIALGLITYIAGKIVTKKAKEITPIVWVMGVIFLAYLFIEQIVIANHWF